MTCSFCRGPHHYVNCEITPDSAIRWYSPVTKHRGECSAQGAPCDHSTSENGGYETPGGAA